jgi:RND family efflux transporter MFP subunit
MKNRLLPTLLGIFSVLPAQANNLGCLVEPSQIIEVGAPVIGVIERIDAERGDTVSKGQTLAQLQSDVERAALALATTRASAQAELLGAMKAHEFARRKQDRNDDLHQKQFISAQALDQTATESAIALQRIEQAREHQELARREHALAFAQLRQRIITSPIDGIVVDRYMSVGERVENKPLYKVASVNPLRVEVVVPAILIGRVRPGAEVAVKLGLPGAPELKAKVKIVDRVVDPASNSFRVRLELPNPRNAIPAGVRCTSDLSLSIDSQAPVVPGTFKRAERSAPAQRVLLTEPR